MKATSRKMTMKSTAWGSIGFVERMALVKLIIKVSNLSLNYSLMWASSQHKNAKVHNYEQVMISSRVV